MYLLAQIWWLLLLAFLLGTLIGYVIWRACGRPRFEAARVRERRKLEDRMALLERENARLEATASEAAATIKKLEGARAAAVLQNVTPEPAVTSPVPSATSAAPPPRRVKEARPEPSGDGSERREETGSASNGFLHGPRNGKPDNLKLIRGIGPRLEKVLNAMGVFHFDQIAGWTEKDLAVVDSRLGDFAGRAVRDKWIEQGQKLAARVSAGENAGNVSS